MIRTPQKSWRRPCWAMAMAGLVGLVCAVPSVAVRSADEHGPENKVKLLRYPDGSKTTETYKAPAQANAAVPMAISGLDTAPQAMAVAAAGLPEGEESLVLKIRTAISISEGDDPSEEAVTTVAATAPKEQIGSHLYQVLYKKGDAEIPITKATRTLISGSGKAIAVRDRNVPIGKITVDGTVAEVEFEQARELAVKNPDVKVGAVALFKAIYPEAKPQLVVASTENDQPHLEIFPAPDRKSGRLAWRFSLVSSDPAHAFYRRYWVSAIGQATVLDYEDRVFLHGGAGLGCENCNNTPNPLRPESDVLNINPKQIDFAPLARPMPFQPEVVPVSTVIQAQAQLAVGTSGTVTGMVWKVSPYNGGLESRPLAGLTVTVKKGAQTFTTVTDGLGKYALANVAGPVQVTATLSGPMAKIQTVVGSVLTVSKSGTGTIDLAFSPTATNDFEVSQVSAFQGINATFNFARSFLPANPTKLNNMVVKVNINQPCNAFYSPGSTNFFRKAPGNSCPNTAYGDVAYHEYGHAIDDQMSGIPSGAFGYSEGFGDAMCLLITKQPRVGRDFFGPGTTLRDARTAPLWPTVQNGEVHSQGHSYSGFCWKLITKLQALYMNDDAAFTVAKRLILGAGTLNPNSIPDAVRLMFFVDKQTFPVMTKSKHYDLIKAAANEMQIPHPQNPANLLATE